VKNIDIKEVAAYIRKNSSTIKVETAAKHFGYSLSHFSREFKKAMRVSASEYISALKIEQSIKYLADEKTKVLDAQLDTGYSSTGTFSKFFSRFTGLSPKQFQTELTGLYGDLKKHEAKEEEGAIHYPPLPKTYNTNHKCHVHIIAPEQFRGIIFVGLFDKPLSNRPPVIGKALVKSRVCAFEDTPPPGNYYVMVCSIERQLNPLNYFILDSCLRDLRREPVAFPLVHDEHITLTLRKILPDDPPITINLPKLLKEGLENKFFKKAK
jgi:AraC-like DNA-binding protein